MSCEHPILAYYDTRVKPARVLFKAHPSWIAFDKLPDGVTSIALPCGKCFGCLKSRALDVTVRAVAESRMHDFSSFITLTVDEDKLYKVFPKGLCHRPWQLFAKRLRKRIGSFTFLMCAEYGERTLRPHYHAIIFGHRFVDSDVGTDSKVLSACWPYGFVTVSDAIPNRIAYVAGYTCKDFALGRTKQFYISRSLGLPYIKWSRNPSLGKRYFLSYGRDLISDRYQLCFVINNKSFNFGGRYFFKLFSLYFPELFDRIQSARLDSLRQDDLTAIVRHEKNKRTCAVRKYNLSRKKEISAL